MSTTGVLLLALAALLIYEGVKLVTESGRNTDAAAAAGGTGNAGSAPPAIGGGGAAAGGAGSAVGNASNPPPLSGSGGVLSPLDLARGLDAAGMPRDAIPNMVAILLAENGGRIQGTSAAGAQSFAQFMPSTYIGVGGNPADLNNPDPGAVARVFQGVVRLWQQQGYNPWDPWRYVAGQGPYGEQYVGPGQGSYRQFLPQAQAAVAQL